MMSLDSRFIVMTVVGRSGHVVSICDSLLVFLSTARVHADSEGFTSLPFSRPASMQTAISDIRLAFAISAGSEASSSSVFQSPCGFGSSPNILSRGFSVSATATRAAHSRTNANAWNSRLPIRLTPCAPAAIARLGQLRRRRAHHTARSAISRRSRAPREWPAQSGREGRHMNGADALIRTFAECGVRTCFANPGTSEMHLVAALDREPRIRSILCLFEGVATGAADGYARITGRPAMTLLHLGPGYLNGAANLHNARRAFAPTINVIGDHATYHRHLDAPLTSDIEALVKPLAAWTDVAAAAADVGPKAAAAYAASLGPPGGNAFLLLPADAAWSEGGALAKPLALPGAERPKNLETVARAIKAARKPAILVSGDALVEPGLTHAARLHAAGVLVLNDTFATRQRRGGAHFAPLRLPYFAEQTLETLQGVDLLITAGTKHPVAFFAYPGRPSELTPE